MQTHTCTMFVIHPWPKTSIHQCKPLNEWIEYGWCDFHCNQQTWTPWKKIITFQLFCLQMMHCTAHMELEMHHLFESEPRQCDVYHIRRSRMFDPLATHDDLCSFFACAFFCAQSVECSYFEPSDDEKKYGSLQYFGFVYHFYYWNFDFGQWY